MKVVVVGCGKMGERHARTLRRMGVEVGLVDVDQARQDALAAELGNSQGPFQAAVVAVPTTQHYAMAKSLLERGLDVLVEKPLTETPKDAFRLIDLAEANKRVLHAGHIERFNPAFLRLAAAIKTPIYAEVSRCSVENGRCLDVSVVLDLMIHDIDLLVSLLGMPLRVHGTGSGDSAEARLFFPCGSSAKLRASRVHDRDVREWHTWDVNFPGMEEGYMHADLYAERARLADQLTAFLDACQHRELDYRGAETAADALMVAAEINRQVHTVKVAA